MDAENREDSIYFASLSEQGERYEDMIKYMKKVAKVSSQLPCHALLDATPASSAVGGAWYDSNYG